MYIHSVSLKNFRSIGENRNKIILEPNVTAIIGKNESGKSNVLEGLSNISLLGNMTRAFNADKVNRNNGATADIVYSIVLKPTPDEQASQHILDDTQITICQNSYAVTGGILTYYNDCVRDSVANLILALGKNPFGLGSQYYTTYQTHIAALQKAESLHFSSINAALVYIGECFSKSSLENEDALVTIYNDTVEKWNVIYSMIPSVFYRNADKTLKNQYSLDDVKKELANPADSLLMKFVELIGVTNDEFITAVQAGVAGPQISIRSKINRNVESKINAAFKDFYTAESVSLNVVFNSNVVSFSIQSSDGETLLLSERSNGLRWYLNTFIDALARGVSKKKNVVYLFDEPGTSLHVNAQKELLKLFHDLANKGNQVIYATHSPYMLDLRNDGIHRVRAVEKDASGYTYIYKTAYDAQLSPGSQKDTLAPIISALGMNLCDTFGPAKDKLNIVIEGVSDYIYISTIAKKLGYDLSKYYFIPSRGATNCINICAILYGWGCPFCAVFDYDKEGVVKGGEVLRREFQFKFGKHYLYIKPVEQKDVEQHTYKSSPCEIEDIVTRAELDEFVKSEGIAEKAGKTLIAKLFCNAVEAGTHTFGKQCEENFKNLLDRIIDINV